MIDNADDNEIAQMYKKLSSTSHTHRGADLSRREQWKPRNFEDARMTIDLLLNDVGLRVAGGDVDACEPPFKVMCAEVVDRIRNKKGIVGNERATTIGLSVNVASVMTRAVEEAICIISAENAIGSIVEKNPRSHAPVWGTVSCRGSGVSFNAKGKDIFKRALRVLSKSMNHAQMTDIMDDRTVEQ